MSYTKQQILAMKQIGNEWQKAGKHRIYFNDLAGFYGLDVSRYNTGNISGADLNGERISNSAAKRILSQLAGLKIWFDFEDNKIHGKFDPAWCSRDKFEAVRDAIETHVNQIASELVVD